MPLNETALVLLAQDEGVGENYVTAGLAADDTASAVRMASLVRGAP